MKIIFAFIPFSILAPAEITETALRSIYIPENSIVIEGTDDENQSVKLEFDKSKNIVKKHEKGEQSEFKLSEAPLFLRLFFFNAEKKKPESFSEEAKNLLEALHNAGVDTELVSMSVSDSDNKAALAVGKERRFSDKNANFLEFSKDSKLPVMLKIGEESWLFSDYHRSLLPLAFPGKIKFFKNGAIAGEWNFLRSEFKSSGKPES